MSDLNLLIRESYFNGILKIDGQIKPIWILLVDEGPDENLHYMKNILQYCRMFHIFDLNYLSIQTHTSGQSVFNLIECSMAILSQKLASIILPIDKYDFHFNSQGQVVDLELAMKNFCYASEVLCTL
ncbi:2490_t:CDS:1 [Funneliformis geosporum]|uniref:2490_t:CDS:1 n=1 Tax=Funneliformis geosporum TaxID=1117311 RepID=A0A9W4WUP8_9GLOM|nr:2490_t:CDS:1 [Funneliformis geosporum]